MPKWYSLDIINYMGGEKRVPGHHFKQDLMIAAAAIILLLVFFLDKKFNESRFFNGLLNRQGRVEESVK